jgi:hypothetical protein
MWGLMDVFQGGARLIVPAAAGLAAVVATGLAPAPPARAAGPAAKYYFQLHEVKSGVPIDAEIRRFTEEAVREELASRPEWASNLAAPASDPEAIAAELKKRNLRGFDVVVKIADLKKEMKDPSPGSRLKRIAVTVKLEVLGTTLPGEKVAFAGAGEAGAESEVPERRVDAEAESLAKDSIKDALKRAVDQAVMKLGMPQSAPMNEKGREKDKKKRNKKT